MHPSNIKEKPCLKIIEADGTSVTTSTPSKLTYNKCFDLIEVFDATKEITPFTKPYLSFINPQSIIEIDGNGEEHPIPIGHWNKGEDHPVPESAFDKEWLLGDGYFPHDKKAILK